MRAASIVATLPLLSAAAAGSPPDEARFDVLVGGKKAGVATYRISAAKSGGRTTELRIVLADGSISDTITQSDRTGAAVAAESSVRRGTAKSREIVVFDGAGNATLTRDKGTPIAIPFDRRGGRRDPSELWFRSVTPSPGTWAVFRALDTRKRKWQEVRVTYVGRRAGGNLVRQQRDGLETDFTLDDNGIPVTMESKGLRMVRR